jgi:chemotaxis protein MotA
MLNQKLIMEGIIAISKEQNSHRLEKKLTSFLAPSERLGKSELLKAITKKYITRQRAANERTAEEARPREEMAFNDSVPMPQPMEMPSPGHLRLSPLARAN